MVYLSSILKLTHFIWQVGLLFPNYTRIILFCQVIVSQLKNLVLSVWHILTKTGYNLPIFSEENSVMQLMADKEWKILSTSHKLERKFHSTREGWMPTINVFEAKSCSLSGYIKPSTPETCFPLLELFLPLTNAKGMMNKTKILTFQEKSINKQ